MTTGPASTTGHGSHVANKLDPRVDSDATRRDHGDHTTSHAGAGLVAGHDGAHGTQHTSGTLHAQDHSHNVGANTQGMSSVGDAHHATGLTTDTGLGEAGRQHQQHTTTGPASTTSHGSHVADKLDPRVDSSREGANLRGHSTTHDSSHPSHTGTGIATGAATEHGIGHHGASEANRGADGPATKTDGPHSSNLANKLDPRVDSDRDHSHNMGANPQGSATTGNTTSSTTGSTGAGAFSSGPGHTRDPTATTGSHVPEGTYGPHGSRTANTLDPRVDSDRDGSNTAGAAHTGTHASGTHVTGTGAADTHAAGAHLGPAAMGPAPNTAGPHKQDLLNKADPRVDSDLDASKTVGGDKNFSQS